MQGSRKKVLGTILPAVRFEPGVAGWEARTLPLHYAVPHAIAMGVIVLVWYLE